MLEAVKNLKPDSARRMGLVVCLQSGCVQYTYRFFDEALADPATASPLLFPETVFAAPASHLAALLENTPLVSTLIGDPATFAQGTGARRGLAPAKSRGCRRRRRRRGNQLAARRCALASRTRRHHQRRRRRGGLCRDAALSAGVELSAITKPQSYSARSSRRQAAQAMRAELPAGSKRIALRRLGDSPRADAPEIAAWRDWSWRAVESKSEFWAKDSWPPPRGNAWPPAPPWRKKSFPRPSPASSAATSRRWASVFRLAPARTSRTSFETVQIMEMTTALKLKSKVAHRKPHVADHGGGNWRRAAVVRPGQHRAGFGGCAATRRGARQKIRSENPGLRKPPSRFCKASIPLPRPLSGTLPPIPTRRSERLIFDGKNSCASPFRCFRGSKGAFSG
jgi:hypothetical protein